MRLVPTQAIQPGMRLGKTIPMADGRAFLAAGTLLKRSFIEPLLRQGVAAVYVVNELAPDVTPTDVVAEETRQSLKAEMSAVLAQLGPVFADAAKKESARFSVGLDTERLQQAVHRVVGEVLANPSVVFNLKDIRTTDEYTLGHSVNVCILSTLLGTVMGYQAAELEDLATGALLHDVGKMAIPDEVLNKPGRLTPEELAIMNQHTVIGWQILRHQRSIRATASIVALQHHERWLGGGYPNGLRGEAIYKHSRLCTVADCFDAMTSDRVYRTGMSPAKALEVMNSEMQGFFQPGLAWSFSQCVAPYPIGSLVEITGGQGAVVVEVKRGKTYQPKVRVVLDEHWQVLPDPFEVDLTERTDVQIVRMVQEGQGEWEEAAISEFL